MTNPSKTAKPQPTSITVSDASRIQSAEAKANGGKVPKGGFAARAQRAAARKTQN